MLSSSTMEINKKNLIAGLIIMALLLGTGFFVYQYFFKGRSRQNGTDTGIATGSSQPSNNSSRDNSGEVGNSNQSLPDIEINIGGIQSQSPNAGGSLSICADACGDSICQKADTKCEGDNFNCVCPETSANCPQDCK